MSCTSSMFACVLALMLFQNQESDMSCTSSMFACVLALMLFAVCFSIDVFVVSHIKNESKWFSFPQKMKLSEHVLE